MRATVWRKSKSCNIISRLGKGAASQTSPRLLLRVICLLESSFEHFLWLFGKERLGRWSFGRSTTAWADHYLITWPSHRLGRVPWKKWEFYLSICSFKPTETSEFVRAAGDISQLRPWSKESFCNINSDNLKILPRLTSDFYSYERRQVVS
jgi:hypothetical protein